MNKKILIGGAIVVAASIAAASYAFRRQMPEKARPVQNFDVERYLGTWFEMARIDFRFEKNLSNVTAQYSLDENGRIKVLNRGYNFKKHTWQAAEGKAKFWDDEDMASLQVSFFGPFYSGYNVIALDKDYRYALVAGRNLDYLWILSRNKNLPDDIKKSYLQLAERIGYDTSRLIWTVHDKAGSSLFL